MEVQHEQQQAVAICGTTTTITTRGARLLSVEGRQQQQQHDQQQEEHARYLWKDKLALSDSPQMVTRCLLLAGPTFAGISKKRRHQYG